MTSTSIALNYIKRIFFLIAGTTLAFSACKKDRYYEFSGKELDFVNYNEGQVIKFIDTTSVTYTLKQSAFRRDFFEVVSILVGTGDFMEQYQVSYVPTVGNSLFLGISHDKNSKTIDVDFCNYSVAANKDSLFQGFPEITINGVRYTNAYAIKVYKNEPLGGNSDTATLYPNRQYGVLQLMFPDGKRIVRTD